MFISCIFAWCLLFSAYVFAQSIDVWCLMLKSTALFLHNTIYSQKILMLPSPSHHDWKLPFHFLKRMANSSVLIKFRGEIWYPLESVIFCRFLPILIITNIYKFYPYRYRFSHLNNIQIPIFWKIPINRYRYRLYR